MKYIILSVSLLISSISANSYSTKSNWLMDTNSSDVRFQKIQKQLRGFDLAMVEVGYRFNSLYFAIKDNNLPLASYQLDKIKKAIKNGIERREKRTKNSKIFFLDTKYKDMQKSFKSKDTNIILQEFNRLQESCNSCHNAERVPFIKVITPKYRWQPIK